MVVFSSSFATNHSGRAAPERRGKLIWARTPAHRHDAAHSRVVPRLANAPPSIALAGPDRGALFPEREGHNWAALDLTKNQAASQLASDSAKEPPAAEDNGDALRECYEGAWY